MDGSGVLTDSAFLGSSSGKEKKAITSMILAIRIIKAPTTTIRRSAPIK